MRVGVTPLALETHYKIAELVALSWVCRDSIVKRFESEPDVMRWSTSIGKRRYESVSIPESVALRVHERICQNTLQARLAGRNPLRVISLRDRHTGVAKKTRDVVKLKSCDQLPHRKCVSETVGPAVVDTAA